MRPIQRTAYVDNAYNLVCCTYVLEDTFFRYNYAGSDVLSDLL